MKLTIDFEPKKVGLEPIALDITDGMIDPHLASDTDSS